MRFSIIVPVYNAEKYLDACADSVLGQTFRDFELLLIDDGSSDDSGALCEKIAAQDARVSVIHQNNSGPSVARNKGIQKAKGEYLLFLDSDDCYADTTVLQKVTSCILASGADVVCMNYARFGGRPGARGAALLPMQECSDPGQMVARTIYTSSACLKAIRTKLVRGAGICFPEGVRCEDVDFCGRVLAMAPSMAYCPDASYLYRVNPASATHNITRQTVENLFAIIESLENQAQAMPEEYPQRSWLLNYTAFQYATLIINENLCTQPLPRALRQRIRAARGLLKYDACAQVKLIRNVSRICGFACMSRMLTLYFRLFRA